PIAAGLDKRGEYRILEPFEQVVHLPPAIENLGRNPITGAHLHNYVPPLIAIKRPKHPAHRTATKLLRLLVPRRKPRRQSRQPKPALRPRAPRNRRSTRNHQAFSAAAQTSRAGRPLPPVMGAQAIPEPCKRRKVPDGGRPRAAHRHPRQATKSKTSDDRSSSS